MLEGSFITSVKTNQRRAWPAGREGAVAWPGQDAERWRRRERLPRLKALVPLLKDNLRGLARYPTAQVGWPYLLF